MINFGYEMLVSMLLPGSIVMTSVIIIIWRSCTRAAWEALCASVGSNEILVAFGAVLLASMCGGILAVVMEAVEKIAIARISCLWIKIPKKIYDRERLRFIDSTEGRENRQISWESLMYFFRLRTGAALMIFSGCAWNAAPDCDALQQAIRWSGFAGIVLLLAAAYTYFEIVGWRHRRFGAAHKTK